MVSHTGEVALQPRFRSRRPSPITTQPASNANPNPPLSLARLQAETELGELEAKLADLQKQAEGQTSGLDPDSKGQKALVGIRDAHVLTGLCSTQINVTKPNDKDYCSRSYR
jgi:hypothetical protein